LQSIVFSTDWLRQPVFWFVQFLFVLPFSFWFCG
jgi:hypothetical protein